MDWQTLSRPGTVHIENDLFAGSQCGHLFPRQTRLAWHQINSAFDKDDSHHDCLVGAGADQGFEAGSRNEMETIETDSPAYHMLTPPSPSPHLTSSSSRFVKVRKRDRQCQSKCESSQGDFKFEARRGVPATSLQLHDILPSLVLMARPDMGNISISSQIQVIQILIELARHPNFPEEITKLTNMDVEDTLCSKRFPSSSSSLFSSPSMLYESGSGCQPRQTLQRILSDALLARCA
jgi:hypothetical protein